MQDRVVIWRLKNVSTISFITTEKSQVMRIPVATSGNGFSTIHLSKIVGPSSKARARKSAGFFCALGAVAVSLFAIARPFDVSGE
jgi:hypothetical protein